MHKPRVMPHHMVILRRKFHWMEAVHRNKALRKKGFPEPQIAYGILRGAYASVRHFLL